MPGLTPEEWSAVQLSLRVGLLSTAVSLPFGLFFAWLLARRDFLGKGLLNGIVHLPLVLPPVVVGYALLVLLGRKGAIGAWLYDSLGVTVAFKWEGAAVASRLHRHRAPRESVHHRSRQQRLGVGLRGHHGRGRHLPELAVHAHRAGRPGWPASFPQPVWRPARSDSTRRREARESGKRVGAREPGAGEAPIIEDAPGSYVKVRADS